MQQYEGLSFDREGSVATITLDRDLLRANARTAAAATEVAGD